jgi:2-dehydro-3-deoxygalactonokinase
LSAPGSMTGQTMALDSGAREKNFSARDVDWIGADWGTTHLRVWALGARGEILARRSSDRGMSVLGRAEYELALTDLVSDLIPGDRTIPIIACGMVGSRQGWVDAGYVETPCPPPGIAGSVKPGDSGFSVHILAGVKQTKPADVMRGEETQIAGYLREQPDFDGVVCLPGTHTKWARVREGQIEDFQTFMTGELFSLLSNQSVLRHSIMATKGWDGEAFGAAINEAIAQPAAFAAQLFTLRAASLIDSMTPETARARLSGLLIGVELAAARHYWRGRDVAIIGRKDLVQLYREGLEAQGVAPRVARCKDMALAGLSAAYHSLNEAVK